MSLTSWMAESLHCFLVLLGIDLFILILFELTLLLIIRYVLVPPNDLLEVLLSLSLELLLVEFLSFISLFLLTVSNLNPTFNLLYSTLLLLNPSSDLTLFWHKLVIFDSLTSHKTLSLFRLVTINSCVSFLLIFILVI